MCSVCKTVFPNEKFPETVVVECTWGRGQKFSFLGGETFKCFGYAHSRPSLSGIIRERKVAHMTKLLDTLATAYALTGQPQYALGTKAILLRFAEVFAEYLVLAGLAGDAPGRASARDALFRREPGIEERVAPSLRLPDVVFPFLAQGYLRTGPTGRESLVMLNASDYGGHHHLDSLNLYLWQCGRGFEARPAQRWELPVTLER